MNSDLKFRTIAALSGVLGVFLGCALTFTMISYTAPVGPPDHCLSIQPEACVKWAFCVLIPNIGSVLGSISFGALAIGWALRPDEHPTGILVFIEIFLAAVLGAMLGGIVSLALPLDSPCYRLYL